MVDAPALGGGAITTPLDRYRQPPPHDELKREERTRGAQLCAESAHQYAAVYLTACIINSYGHEAAHSLLRRRRAQELLASRRAARRHTAGRQPADPLARGAPGAAATRPLGAASRADRGRVAPLPWRTAPTRPRAAT